MTRTARILLAGDGFAIGAIAACVPGAILGPGGAPAWLVAAIFAIVCSCFAARAAAASVTVYDDKLVVRNPVRMYELLGSDVLRLWWTHGGPVRTPVPGASRRAGGRAVKLYAAAIYGSRSGEFSPIEEKIIGTLRAWADRNGVDGAMPMQHR